MATRLANVDGSSTSRGSEEGQAAAPSYTRAPVMVETSAEVARMAERLSTATVIGVDLEADSLYHYFEKVCLIQLTALDEDYIVDPLSGADLGPLAAVLEDDAIKKIFHGADGDMALLRHSCGIETRNIFDTMVAAQIAGHQQFGLGNLIRHYFGIQVDKRFQRHNWSLRPLGPEHILYARSDTHFLRSIRDHLWAEIEVLGREDQAREEIAMMEQHRLSAKEFSPDQCLRLSGVRELDVRELKILRQLYLTRDRLACERDIPPFRILPNEVVVMLARRAPRTQKELGRLRGLRSRTIGAHGAAIVEAINLGLEADAIKPQPPPRKPRVRSSSETEARFKRLKVWRQEKLEVLALSPQMVAANSVLKAVARAAPESLDALREVPEVRRWQVKAFGEEWLRLLAKS